MPKMCGKFKVLSVTLGMLCILCCVNNLAFSETPTSDSYAMPSFNISSFSASKESTNFSLIDAGGNFAVGTSDSINYLMSTGPVFTLFGEEAPIRVWNATHPKGYPTIADALSDLVTLQNGDIITTEAGVFKENIVWPDVDNITLIGAGSGITTIDGQNLERCITITPEVNMTIEGFTVTRGVKPNYMFMGSYSGGGIYHRSSIGEVSVVDCIFTANRTSNGASSGAAGGNGGAIYTAGDAYIASSEFIANSSGVGAGLASGGNGGAVYIEGIAAINACKFINNRTGFGASGGGVGGAIYVVGTSEFIGCTFSSNSAEGGGSVGGSGGAVGAWLSDYSFTNCLFENNFTGNGGGMGGYGGAVYANSNGKFTGCEFYSNHTGNASGGQGGFGGAVYLYGSIEATNCIFANDQAGNGGNKGGDGGAISASYGNIVNSVFYANASGTGTSILGFGGAVSFTGTNPSMIKNSIFWANTSYDPSAQISAGTVGSVTTIEYCDIQGGTAGITGTYDYKASNISSEPLFISSTYGSTDFLKPLVTSETVDSGTFEGAPAFDITGLIARPSGEGFDMGVYEQAGPEALLAIVYVSDSLGNDTTGTGTSPATAYKTIQKGLNKVAQDGTVEVSNGTYTEHDILWPARENIILHGESADLTIISAEALGKGIMIGSNVAYTVENLTIKDGLAPYSYYDVITAKGGGVSYAGTNRGTFNCCIFLNDRTALDSNSGDGGAIYSSGEVVLINCNFASNRTGNATSSGNGGAVFAGSATVVNTTMYNNAIGATGSMSDRGKAGGLYVIGNGPTSIVNSIFWNNDGYNNAYFAKEIFSPAMSTISIRYSDIQDLSYLAPQGVNVGDGCVDIDPKFASTDYGDPDFLKPLVSSETVDSGTFEGAPLTAIDGTLRPLPIGTLRFDMGVYEQSKDMTRPTTLEIEKHHPKVKIKWSGTDNVDVWVLIPGTGNYYDYNGSWTKFASDVGPNEWIDTAADASDQKYYRIAAVGSALFSLDGAGSIESVGKFTLELTDQKLNLISIPLVQKSEDLLSVIGTEDCIGSTSGDPYESDMIYKYISTGQEGYYSTAFLIKGSSADERNNKWWDVEELNNEHYVQSAIMVRPTEGYWIRLVPGSGTRKVTIVGKVATGEIDININTDRLRLVGSPYPAQVTLFNSDLWKYAKGTSSGAPEESDKIYKFNGDPVLGNYNSALLMHGSGDPTYDDKWFDIEKLNFNEIEETTIQLKPGEGYWLETVNGDYKWKYPKAY